MQSLHQLVTLVVIMGGLKNSVNAQASVTRACSLQVVVDHLLWSHHWETQLTNGPMEDAEVDRITRYFMNELSQKIKF